jgi:hypothetical protein
MALACEVSPAVISSASIAVFVCGFEVPVEKADLKQMAKKTEVTSTASLYQGVIWEEFAPGASGGTFDFDSKWRPSGSVLPPSLRTGAIYPVSLYVRRPLTNGATDAGSAFSFNFFVENVSLTFDPKSGVIDWKVSGAATGPIIQPT